MIKSARPLLLAGGAAFLAFLDVTVVNLVIPVLGQTFPHGSIASLSWVITAYAIALAALLAPSGRLADAIGRRTLFRLRRWGFLADVGGVRGGADRARAAARPSAAGCVGGGDDPRVPGDRADRHSG